MAYDTSEIMVLVLSLIFINGIVLFCVFSLPRIIKSNKIKKFANTIGATFLRREKNWFLDTETSYQKFNIVTGKYNGQPLEIYQLKISSPGLSPYYHTYINGKKYGGLLSDKDIKSILDGNNKFKDDTLSSFMRTRFPW